MREAFSIGLRYFLVGFAIFFALWGGRPTGGGTIDEGPELNQKLSLKITDEKE